MKTLNNFWIQIPLAYNHALCWIVYDTYILLVYWSDINLHIVWLIFLFATIRIKVLFYGVLYFLNNREKYKSIVIKTVYLLLVFTTYVAFIFLYRALPPSMLAEDLWMGGFWDTLLVRSWEAFDFIILAFVLHNYNKNINYQRANLIVEKQLLQEELTLKKSVIDKGFISTYLTVFQQKTDSVALADAIGGLSTLLDYTLEDEFMEITSVENELTYIDLFIKLNSYRFDGNIEVIVEKRGNLNEIKLPKILLLTLVENAFKHGDLITQPLKLKFELIDGRFEFSMLNKIRNSVITKSLNIGLENSRNRLQLLNYDHKLTGKSFDGFFETVVIIHTKR